MARLGMARAPTVHGGVSAISGEAWLGVARRGKARAGRGHQRCMVAYPRFKTGLGGARLGWAWQEHGEGTNGAWWRYAIQDRAWQGKSRRGLA